jgi:flagellum-specific ATP synthase
VTSSVNEPLKQQFNNVSQQFIDMATGIRSQAFDATGKLLRFSGSRLEVGGLKASIGSRCLIEGDDQDLTAEVIGFDGDRLILACEDAAIAVSSGASVRLIGSNDQVLVGADLLGRVIDGAGLPLDDMPLNLEVKVPLRGGSINPMNRAGISQPLDVGVRSINALLSIGRGQRIGLFAGSGVGKSTLLGMITRFTDADVVVVGLVGERGREVREFIEDSLGPEGLKRAVVVATPADTSPLMRVSGCWRATAIAEYYRAQGLNVLLLMDSLTRFAQAQREIALSAGEPPVAKGYTPSVFSLIPSLIERAGIVGKGSITAIYTVLVEGDDLQDPVADVARASLDGHIVLSRRMADAGMYPAIDLGSSVSRSMMNIADPQHQQHASFIKDLYSTYEENRDLISIGAYRQGSDPKIDIAISAADNIRSFIKQPVDEAVTFSESIDSLGVLVDGVHQAPGSDPNGLASQNNNRAQMRSE